MKKILIEKLIIKKVALFQSEGIHTILMKHEDRSTRLR